jgi:hypothetical protein
MDPSEFRKQVISRAVKSPVVAVPAVAGGLVMVVGLLLAEPTGFLSFLGASGLFFAAGMALTRLVWGSRAVAESVHEDYMKGLEGDHEAYLGELQKRLDGDGDERTNESLARLRKVHERLRRGTLLRNSVDTVYVSEIRDKVEQLYWSCLKTLARTYDFRQAAAEMATPEARQEMLQHREQLLSEVSSGIGHLEATVDQLRAKQLEHGAGERELQQVRSELDMGLEVARQVERRMAQFEEGLAATAEKTPE